jgi:hypothetical protein
MLPRGGSVRIGALIAWAVLCSLLWACDDSGSSEGVPDAAAAACREAGANDALLAGVAESFCLASFKATYDWRVNIRDPFESDGFPLPTKLTLYKLGLTSMKIDAVIEQDGDGEARLVVIAEELDEGGEGRYIICSISGALPFPDQDGCYEDDTDEPFAAIYLYSIMSWLYGGSGLGELQSRGTRSLAGESGNCYANIDVNEVEAEYCYTESGVSLYARRGENIIELTSLELDVSTRDFEPPLAVVQLPTPAGEFPTSTPTPPDEAVEIRIAPAAGASPADLSSQLDVLRGRAKRVDPSCIPDSKPLPPDDPANRFLRECLFVENGEVILRFTISGFADRWTDDEFDAWLTATGDPSAVRVRFCEPMLDTQGAVAVVESGRIAYAPGTCEPDLGDANVSYVDRLEADPDAIVWTPAVGELDRRQRAFTDDLLVGAWFDSPSGPGVNYRFFYEPSREGELILESIWDRLGPTADRRQRTSDDHYSLALFVDGELFRNLDGEIALLRVDRVDWGPFGIINLSREEAMRITRLVVGPDLTIPLEVLSISRSQAVE